MDKKQTRAKFYEDICRKLKQTKPWVKEVLSTHFENSFDPDLIPEYTKVLENENYLQMTKDRLLEKYSNHSIVQPDPCPCGAPAVPDVLWGWICTVGGTRHRNIERYATRRGISFEEALRFTDLVKEEQETRMNLELETWTNAIQDKVQREALCRGPAGATQPESNTESKSEHTGTDTE